MEEDLLFALDEPFVPTPPISAFPRDEHGDVFPTKKTRTFDYEKQAASIYRPHNILFKLKRLAYRAIGLAVGEPVVFFRYHLKIENRSVFHRHRAELKDGFITVANHVFPLDCLAVSAVRPFRVPEFPIWQDGFESSNGGMYQAYGGFPVVKNAEGWEKAYRCMKEVLLEKKWLHVYPEAACWYYYVPIREFLNGTFRLAYETGRPITPLAFSFRKREGLAKLFFAKEPLVTLRIGEPLYAKKELSLSEAVVDLRKRIHASMVALAGLSGEKENAELKKRYSYH
jgi:1-acyl-sn-glycerol-3-phosphate acyltransferase